jgi:hypothetical protein
MAPVGVDRADVVTVRRTERAQRADQPPATQRDLDDHAISLEANGADPRPFQGQQRRECGGDAHGTIDLQFAGFDTSDPTADPVRVSGSPIHRAKPPLKPKTSNEPIYIEGRSP